MPDRANAAADAVLAANASGNALADLENRSPGSRLGDIALKAKRAISRLLPGRPDEDVPAPEQRALGKVFDPPASDDFTFSPLAEPAPPMALAAPSEAVPEEFLPIGGGGFTPGAPGGGITPGGGGGGGGGGNNPPPPAVPEPETWALMLLGFAAVGGAMRRQSRKGRLFVQL